MAKERVDILCVEQGLFESREKAKRAIMAGIVHDDHQKLDKPGMKIPTDTVLSVKGEKLKYVSRGGLKLEKAINMFHLDLHNKIMLDIGSSTGGFTDCALQNGALKVYALDVGTNQLVWKLRNDARVIVMEQTNFRYCTLANFQEGQPEVASIDVSFISLSHIFSTLKNILVAGGDVAALIKPQFEAGREQVGKHGIVKDAKVHEEVIKKVLTYAQENGFSIKALTYSPITGGEGNIEFLGHFVLAEGESMPIDIADVVKEAHNHFERGE